MEILIKNGRVVDPKSGVDAVTDVSIGAGRIVAMGATPPGFHADRKIDARDWWSAPAWWIYRLACASPGFEYKATLESEMAAAVAGGITSLACSPDTDPVLDEPGLVEMLKHRAQKPEPGACLSYRCAYARIKRRMADGNG